MVDVVLAAKDGWGVDVLGELCASLSLPVVAPSSSPSPSPSPSSSLGVVVEVEIVRATNEALEDEDEEEEEEDAAGETEGGGGGGGGPGNENAGVASTSLGLHPSHPPRRHRPRPRYCLHPTELRVRRRGTQQQQPPPSPAAPPVDGGGGGENDVDDSCACASSHTHSCQWQRWRASPPASVSSKTTTKKTTTTTTTTTTTNNNEQNSAAAATAASTATTAADDKKKASHWQKIKKDNRASTFAALLVREFGLHRLRRGSGVVDVAGGSGELSFELAVRWGVPCTIIDPRGEGVHLTSRHKRLLASRAANFSLITAAWAAASPLARQLAREWGDFTPANAGHIKKWFNASLMDDPVTAALLTDCSAVAGGYSTPLHSTPLHSYAALHSLEL